MHRLLHGLVAAVLYLSTAAIPLQGQASTPTAGGPVVVVRAGDMLRLRLWPDQIYSGDYPVEATGQVYLPLLGEVQAGGRPLDAVRAELQNRYRALVQNSTVAASVVFRVSVLGAVLRPNLYQVDPSTTVLDAISLAGGLRDDADASRVRILREDQSIGLDAALALEGDQTQLAQQVQSGDRIIVPARVAPRITTQGVLVIVQTIATLAVLFLQFRQ